MDTLHRTQTRRIELVGQYDLSQKPELAILLEALAPGAPATIDMTKVTYIDSSVLNELVKLRKRLTPHKVTVVVRSDDIGCVLRLVRLDLLFEIQAL